MLWFRCVSERTSTHDGWTITKKSHNFFSGPTIFILLNVWNVWSLSFWDEKTKWVVNLYKCLTGVFLITSLSFICLYDRRSWKYLTKIGNVSNLVGVIFLIVRGWKGHTKESPEHPLSVIWTVTTDIKIKKKSCGQ